MEWGLLAVVALIWGSSFLLIAEALESMPPAFITFSRLALGMVTLAFVPRSRRPIARADWPQLVAVSIFWMTIPFLLFPVAQQWVSSSTTGMLNGAVPIFSAVVASILLRRPPGAAQAAGLLVGFAGVGLVSFSGGAAGGSTAFGVFLVVLATACYGLAVNLAVPLQQRYGSLPVLWRALGVATACTAPFALLSGGPHDITATGVASILTLGVLGTGLAFVAMTTLAGRTGGTRSATAIYFIPVVALILGVAVRGESVTAMAIVGVALTLGGAFLVSRREAGRVTQRH